MTFFQSFSSRTVENSNFWCDIIMWNKCTIVTLYNVHRYHRGNLDDLRIIHIFCWAWPCWSMSGIFQSNTLLINQSFKYNVFMEKLTYLDQIQYWKTWLQILYKIVLHILLAGMRYSGHCKKIFGVFFMMSVYLV